MIKLLTDFTRQERHQIMEAHLYLSEELGLDLVSPLENNQLNETLKSLVLFENYFLIDLMLCYKLDAETKNFVATIKLGYKSGSGRGMRKYFECQFMGLSMLKKDPGHVFIRPETISDKIVEVFSSGELDFEENPKFSSKYYLLSDNGEQTRKYLDYNFLNAVFELDNVYIEIFEKILLVKFKRKLHKKDVLAIIGFLKNLNKSKLKN